MLQAVEAEFAAFLDAYSHEKQPLSWFSSLSRMRRKPGVAWMAKIKFPKVILDVKFSDGVEILAEYERAA